MKMKKYNHSRVFDWHVIYDVIRIRGNPQF